MFSINYETLHLINKIKFFLFILLKNSNSITIDVVFYVQNGNSHVCDTVHTDHLCNI